MKTLFFFLAILFVIVQAQAQDVIIRMNGDSIHCQIKEIGTSKIKYLRPKFAGQTLFSISKSDVNSIVFENKNIMVFDHSTVKTSRVKYQDPIETGPIDYPITDKQMAIKFNPLAIFGGSFEMSVERSIKRGMSLEFGAAYIFGHPEDFFLFGDMDFSSSGFYARGGIKFIKSSDNYLHHTAHPHRLQGFFVKPEIIYSSLFYTNNGYSSGYTHNGPEKNYFCASFIVNIGKQFVVNNAFSFEWNVGLGVGASNANDEIYFFGSNLHGALPPFYIPWSFTAGFKIGILTD